MKLRIGSLALFAILAGTYLFAYDGATFRGDLAHRGVYDAVGVPQISGLRWKFHAGGQVHSSPAVADGRVFVGSTNGTLFAVDQETGAQQWKFATKGRIVSSPAVQNGVVYVLSYDSNVYALEQATGQLKWKFSTGGERRFAAKHIHGIDPAAETMPDPFDFYLSSPAVWNGAVYFGSSDGNVYALDAASGTLRWKFHTGDVVHASPAIADDTVFIGSWDTYFYALDASTGKEKWRFKTGEDPSIHNQIGIQSSAAIADGIVYFGCRDSNLYALEARTGEKKWVYNNKGSWVIGSPAVKDGKLYFATSDSGLFHAVDAKTGADLFSLSFKWPMFSSPAIAGNLLYIGSHAGKLFAVDLAAEKLAWTFQTESSQQNGPALTGMDGRPDYSAAVPSMFYDDVVSGIQRMFSLGAILSSPVVARDTVYVGSADGNLYAIH